MAENDVKRHETYTVYALFNNETKCSVYQYPDFFPFLCEIDPQA